MISNQISGYKTDKKGLFAQDKLNPAPIERYAQIHDGAEKNQDGTRGYSVIGITLLDYSDRTAGTKTAKGNISPGQIKRLYADAFVRKEEVEMVLNKIYGQPAEDGRVFMDKITIKRASVGSDGKERKYPWYVEIDNGTALPGHTAAGGTYCQAGTYKSAVRNFINLSDEDFFMWIEKIYTYINVWEMSTGMALLASLDESQNN